MLVLAAHGLAVMGNFAIGGGHTLEDFFIHLIDPDKKAGLLTKKKVRPEKSTAVRIAICKALGRIGGERSLKPLRRACAKEKDQALRQAAEAAAAVVAERLQKQPGTKKT